MRRGKGRGEKKLTQLVTIHTRRVAAGVGGEEINFIACLYRNAFPFTIRGTQCVLGSVLEIDE